MRLSAGPVLIREIKEICEKHNEKYQMFCKSHECPCCRKCTIENHQECKDVVIIEDIIQDAKTSVSFDDLNVVSLKLPSFNKDCMQFSFLIDISWICFRPKNACNSDAYFLIFSMLTAQHWVFNIPVFVNGLMLKLKKRIKTGRSNVE
jgi:hypothetical protein